ncbi:MAG: hypothetical protein C5B45_01820 [Chlamydiae bacterium]|nr:MAG: hypothetical protein C5B45_01820 [Chlamydiota bacterium]
MKTKEAIQPTIKEGTNITELDPIANLLNPDLISSAIMQRLIKNDPEGVMEIIEDHLLNKSKFFKRSRYTKIDKYIRY